MLASEGPLLTQECWIWVQNKRPLFQRNLGGNKNILIATKKRGHLLEFGFAPEGGKKKNWGFRNMSMIK